MRRVVTGHDKSGRAVVISDGPPPVESVSATRRAVNVWFTDASPAPLEVGIVETTERPYSIEPTCGGSVFRIYELPPDAQAMQGRSAADLRKVFDANAGGNFSTGKASSPHPLMHRTSTIDYGVVMDGEIFLLVDDTEVHLKAGDLIVQRGTNHAWSNRSDRPCRMAFVTLSAELTPELQAALAQGESPAG